MSDDWTFCYEAIGPVATDTAGLTYPRHFLEYLTPEMRKRMVMLLSHPLSPELDLRGVRTRVLPHITSTGPGKALAAQLSVPMITRRMGVSCVFCSGSIASPLFGLPGSPRLVVNVQNAAPLDHSVSTAGHGRDAYRRVAVPAGLRVAERVITTSKTVGDALGECYGVDSDRITVVPLAADGDRFRPALAGEERAAETGIGQPYVLFVSALWGYKNASTLVEAFAQLVREDGIEHLLVLAGKDGGDMATCRRIAARHGIEDRLVFTGHTRDPLLPALYRHADLFVYPSLIESFGLPLLEAMASGVPVVASNRWAIPEVCGDAALICEPTAEPLAESMRQVLQNPVRAAELRSAGIGRAAQFTWQRTVGDTLRVIEEVARG